MSRTRGRRWRLAGVLVAALVMSLAGVTGVVRATPAFATLGDLPVVTYNMQGATSGADSKWTTTIAPYTNAAPVVTLQEVGSTGPTPAPGTVPQVIPQQQLANSGNPQNAWDASRLPQVGNGNQVVHSQWRVGRSTNLDVYFLQTDPNRNNGVPTYQGGRVNLAIVTQRGADAVAALPNPAGGVARATLGVLLGTTWYFTVHAFSGGGGDAPGILQQINNFVQSRGLGETWSATGDFNRAPATLQATVPAGATVLGQGQPTQQSGNELDYAVYSGQNPQLPQPTATRLAGASSDHYAVAFGPPPVQPAPQPQPQQFFQNQQVIVNLQVGSVLDAFNQGTANFTPIDAYKRTSKANQAWTVNTYIYPDGVTGLSFQGNQSGRCIDITHSDQNPGSGTPLSLFDCNNGLSQQWEPVYEGNSEYQLESLLKPGLCMNIQGGQSDPNTAANLILYACQNTLNERWFFNQAYVPSTASVPAATFPSSPVTVESAGDGGVMDVSQNQTANNSQVVSYSRDGGANQGWNIQPATGGGTVQAASTVAFQGVQSGRCLDIFNSTSVTSGRELVIFNCTGQASQQWHVDPQDNGTIEFENSQYPSLCLDVSGAPTDPRVGNLDVFTCNNQSNQQWYLNPFDPSGAPAPDQDLPDDSGSVNNHVVNLSAAPALSNTPQPAQRIGYYTSWSTYANAFYPKNLDTEGIASKLTVLDYAFENIDPVNLTCFEGNQPVSTDPNTTTGNDGASDAYADYQKEYTPDTSVDGTADVWNQPLRGNFQQLKELKAKYPNLKILLSIGGWTFSKYFSDVAATAASRQKFVSSCIDLYIKGNLPQLGTDPAGGPGAAAGIFDGFDLDWEFPGTNLGHPGNHFSAQDSANYTALLQEFRTELDALGGEHYMLTAVLPAGPANIAQVQPAAMSQYLDYGDLEAYDFHGAFETTGPTNFQAPLYDSPASPANGTGFTVNDAVNTYLQDGFPASKLIVGVPLYGRGWTGVPDGGSHGLYQSVTGATAAFPLSQESGVADYKELEAAGLLTSSNEYFDPTTDSSWVYDGTNFWSIESPLTLAYKRQYIADKGLAGIMMYSLEADDPSATLVNAAAG